MKFGKSEFSFEVQARVAALAIYLVIIMSTQAASSSAHYTILQDTLSAGGGRSSSTSYQIDDSLDDLGGTARSADGQVVVWFGNQGLLSTPNSSPLSRNFSLQRRLGSGVQISISKLIFAANDPDGDALQLLTFDALSTNGATVQIGAGSLVYQPLAGNNSDDSFRFTLSDGHGGESMGTIFVSVSHEDQLAGNSLTRIEVGANEVIVHFVGIPGLQYEIQSTESLTSPNWQTHALAIAAFNGRFLFRDTLRADQNRFYRAFFTRTE